MKNRAYTTRITKRLLSALVLVILPLLAVNQTQAKRTGATKGKATVAIVSLADLSGTNLRNSAELKARLTQLMARNPKAVKVLVKGIGCPAATPQDYAASFWGCLKGCLSDVGIGTYSMIMCGASCVAAWTGAGALLCAVCVGVSVSVIQTCALGCGSYGRSEEIIIEENVTRNTRQPRAPARSLQARLRRQSSALRSQ